MSMTSSQQRIALVCFSRSLGGLELSTLRIAQGMKTKGVYAMVIVPPSSPLHQRALELGLDLATLTPRWKYGDIPAAFHLAKILQDKNIDRVVLMQSQDIHLASLAAYFSRLGKICILSADGLTAQQTRFLAYMDFFKALALDNSYE